MKVEVHTDYATIILEHREDGMCLPDWLELMTQALHGLGYVTKGELEFTGDWDED